MRFSLLFAFCALLALHFGCSPIDDFDTSSGITLEFSVDTLRFDTVFTQVGSATRSIKVYNRNDSPIRISNIQLGDGGGSFFRLNIDGIPGDQASEVEVWANDSIYIFAEVTIDPDQPLSVSPFVIEDKIFFETNGNMQEVTLEAWGQNANYFPSRFNKGVTVGLGCQGGNVVWDDPKPYVIYGIIAIDDCLLTIPAGTRIYVHGGVAMDDNGAFNDGWLATQESGSIHILGTQEDPVIIQGDRLEEVFLDEPGQWTGIYLGRGSKNNIIEHATIRNSIFGVYVDSTAALSMQNVEIYNTSSSGIIGFSSTIEASNVLVYNNDFTSVQLLLGGNYSFNYCTIASYGVDASAATLTNFFCYDDPVFCTVREQRPLTATFENSILFGSRSDELQLGDITDNQLGWFNVSFDNCVVRVDDLLEQEDGRYFNFFNEQCQNCINGDRQSILFVDTGEDDYRLDSLSIADGLAQPNAITIDLEGVERDPMMPDAGCFERVE
ncbi:MAG: right-handed parallel beta-helix repeat-containing protein [Bacteroidota bacterium]